jgi:hypothetical protein
MIWRTIIGHVSAVQWSAINTSRWLSCARNIRKCSITHTDLSQLVGNRHILAKSAGSFPIYQPLQAQRISQRHETDEAGHGFMVIRMRCWIYSCVANCPPISSSFSSPAAGYYSIHNNHQQSLPLLGVSMRRSLPIWSNLELVYQVNCI